MVRPTSPWHRLPDIDTAMRMTWAITRLALLVAALATAAHAAEPTPAIRLNSVGYLPGHQKKTSIAANCKQFALRRVSDGERVFEGEVSGPTTNTDTQEQLYIADFSQFNESGEFQLEASGAGMSAKFRIGTNVYNEPFYLVMRGMYLWRCGTAVTATYHGQTFHHDACHQDDAWLDLVAGRHVKMNATGGWHDAGDYNKYVINASVTVGCMFRAWEDFPAIHRIRLDIPESGGPIPDFLAEIKWETDWLLRMQAGDGSVYHKISTMKFGPFIMPEKETAPRFFVPWASAATADFVAMMSAASRYFRPYDAVYADRCLAAAKKSYEFLKGHPGNHNADMMGVSTGGYSTSDGDDRLWAAAELWEAAGDPEILRDAEERIRSIQGRVDRVWDWGNVSNLGLFTYVLSRRSGREEALINQVRASIISVADAIVRTAVHHGYARPLGNSYSWGCNGAVARQVFNLQIANRLSPKREYAETSLDALNHLFGRNCFGRSFVTGLGFHPPMNPHDRRSGADNIVDPWPGYLVGGPNPRAKDWHDIQADYRTNEIAINWNSALIYALAAFVETSRH